MENILTEKISGEILGSGLMIKIGRELTIYF